jgi:hypothetical protein
LCIVKKHRHGNSSNIYQHIYIVFSLKCDKRKVDQVKEDEMGRACSTNEEKRNAYRILVGNPEGKRPLGRPRRRWVDNIKMDLREIGWDGMN